jgi:hypothetical protein
VRGTSDRGASSPCAGVSALLPGCAHAASSPLPDGAALVPPPTRVSTLSRLPVPSGRRGMEGRKASALSADRGLGLRSLAGRGSAAAPVAVRVPPVASAAAPADAANPVLPAGKEPAAVESSGAGVGGATRPRDPGSGAGMRPCATGSEAAMRPCGTGSGNAFRPGDAASHDAMRSRDVGGMPADAADAAGGAWDLATRGGGAAAEPGRSELAADARRGAAAAAGLPTWDRAPTAGDDRSAASPTPPLPAAATPARRCFSWRRPTGGAAVLASRGDAAALESGVAGNGAAVCTRARRWR